jgi:hypothetical protein
MHFNMLKKILIVTQSFGLGISNLHARRKRAIFLNPSRKFFFAIFHNCEIFISVFKAVHPDYSGVTKL